MRHFAADLSVQCVARFAVLRQSPALEAARAHARNLRQSSCWSFESHATLARLGPEPLADSPAALSHELADLLFGRHPRTRQPVRPAGLTVTEVSWDEWLRCGGTPDGTPD